MKSVFEFRNNVIKQYADFSRSFTVISAPDIKKAVDEDIWCIIITIFGRDKRGKLVEVCHVWQTLKFIF